MASKNISNNLFSQPLLLIQLLVGLIWLKSSYGKVVEGKFLSTIGPTLEKFASNNPHLWFKEFLTSIVIPNAQLVGLKVMAGEVFVAVSLTLLTMMLLTGQKLSRVMTLILGLALLEGLTLNLLFYLAAGYTSPSTESLNILMFGVQLVGLIYLIRNSSHKQL